ncbi:MAG: lipopolysaccharide biosynthesis protein [Desulfobacula sp.]|jgi:O-antigen/teichoic acid export membrane protein|nr:lipopolysaccharide biosynthesis protein [Desulfobacula sp.]
MMNAHKAPKSEKNYSLGDKLKKGVAWQYLQTMFITVFNFGAGIVMARLLDPVDFGLFAAVTAITNLLMLQVTFGWPSAILRAKALDEPLLSTIFWLMESVALLLMIIVVASVPFLGRFYEDTRFAPVMIMVCIQFFIVPFNAINGGLLRWKMRYDLISRISMVVAVISSICGIVLAFKGFGVYSLVISGILSSILLTGIMAVYAPWKPVFKFSLAVIKPHFDFSWRLHLNNSLNLLASRIDNMMIGKLVGMRPLGIYVKSFSLGRMPVDMLATNLYQMFFTALSQLRENKSDSLLMFQKMIAALTFSIYMPLLLLFTIGEGFVFNLYGAKWMGAVLPMQIMIIGSFATVISMACGALCDAQNLVKLETKVQCINIFLTVSAVVFGSKWGLVGISIGIAAKEYIILLLMKNVLGKGIQLRWIDLWHPIWPNLCATSVALTFNRGLIYFMDHVFISPTDPMFLIMSGCISVGFYVFTWLFLAMNLKNHQSLQALFGTFKSVVQKITFK